MLAFYAHDFNSQHTERPNVLLIMAKDIIFLDAAPARRVKN